jgi:hypothetical protein
VLLHAIHQNDPHGTENSETTGPLFNLTAVYKMTWGPVSSTLAKIDNRIIGAHFPAGAVDFRYTTASETESGAHQASNPMGKRSLPGVERPDREADTLNFSSCRE